MKKEWTYKKLGEVCEIICGQDYKTVQDDNGAYPIYGTGGIMGYASQYRCPSNSVIIGRKGNINNPLFVEQPFWNVDTAFGVVPKTTHLIPKYFFYFCKGYDFTKHDVSVTIPSLRRTDILKIQVPVPPLETQSQIVSELDLLQSIIDKQKAQLKELDNLAQAVFYDMFGDPVENEKVWIRLPFESCIQKVKYTTKLQAKDYLDSGKYPIISQEEEYISGYWNNDEDVFSVVSPVVIFGDHTRILKYVDFSFVLGADGVKIFLPISTVTPWYLYYFLKSSDIPSLGYSRHYKLVKELAVPIPPLDLQKTFAAKIESIEKQKAAIKKSIEESQKLFDYTMDKYFG